MKSPNLQLERGKRRRADAGRNPEMKTLTVDGEKCAHQPSGRRRAAKWESQKVVSQQAKDRTSR